MRIEEALAQAMALLRAGQAEAAGALLGRILAVAPNEPDALQLLGMIARGQRDHARAAELFRQSLRTRPGQPHVLNNLGNALLDLGRTEEAIEAYREAVRLQPGYGEALTNLGLAHLAAGAPAPARDTLELAVRADPRSAKAWSALGRALRGLDRLDEALTAFRTSLADRPSHVPTLHNYAVALRLSGDAGEAARILEACAAADPNSAEIRYNLGHCQYDLGRLDAAGAAYREALERAPGYRDAHDSLNRLYWETGDSRYLASYVDAIRSDPADAGLIADLANRLSLGGRADEAAALLEGAIARGVDTASIRERLGQAKAALGAIEPALDHFRAAIDAEPASDAPRLELARGLILLERYGEALDTIAPVRARAPFDQQAIAYQGLAWRFLDDPRAARLNDYERFVQGRILTPPPEWGNVEQFNQRLESVLASRHLTSRHPLEQTLRGGTQTMGELFDRPEPEIRAVRRMIEDAVRDYIAALPDDPDHVFTGRRGAGFRVAGSWSVRLRRQGFHLNHLHSEGWISSCYYVGLPPSVAREDQRRGWIKFGETGLGLGPREQVAKAVRPEVGKLVLFPSYFYHGTYPFDDDAFRTTIAFDVVPD